MKMKLLFTNLLWKVYDYVPHFPLEKTIVWEIEFKLFRVLQKVSLQMQLLAYTKGIFNNSFKNIHDI